MSSLRLPNPPGCLAYDPRVQNPYGYLPSLAAGVIFLVLFGASTALHVWQTFRYRTPWLAAFVLGAFGEFLGWVARTVAHRCSYSVLFFKMQLVLLIIAPAFTTAGVYIILSVLIPILGLHTSPLRPKLYLIIFVIVIVDFFSLLLQAIGGGMAGAAFSKKTDTKPGTNIMVSGIIFQLALTCVFAALFAVVMFRGADAIRRNRHLVILCAATALTVACMVIHGVYRSVELLQGWRGYLITHERFAIALEGAMMFIAVASFNVNSPGFLLL